MRGPSCCGVGRVCVDRRFGGADRQQHIQQHPGEGGEGDGAGGAEDGELLLDGDSRRAW